MLKKIIKFLLVFGLLGVGIYLIGPRPEGIQLDPNVAPEQMSILEIESVIRQREHQTPNIKANNESKIIWNDGTQAKTPYSLVYLHGFSASRGEGDPIHREFASRYGMNAYLPRLDQHGINEKDALLELTAERLVQSAKEALAIGKILGEKVIIMSCSTGSTLALYLAAHNPDMVDGIICFSPNIDLAAAGSSLLDGPWGLQILRMVEGGNYHDWEAPEAALAFWTTSYRIEALIQLRLLIDATMTETTFSRVTQPVHVQYFYKSEAIQDQVVSVEAMHEMYAQLGTPPAKKSMVAIPEAEQHVFVSKYYDCDLTSVRRELYGFAEGIMQLMPVQ